jgi:hypothetical protein
VNGCEPDESEIMEIRFGGNDKESASKNLQRFELARLLVCLDHIARFIVNAYHGVM